VADGESGAREVQSLGLGDAEIHHLDLARRVDVHVVGLDISMNDLLGVNVFERAGDIERDAQAVEMSPACLSRMAWRRSSPTRNSSR